MPEISFWAFNFSFQYFVIILAASAIGYSGFIGLFICYILIMLGFPLLEGGLGGFEIALGPGASILVAYMVGMLVVVFLTKLTWEHYHYLNAIINLATGTLLMFFAEAMYFAVYTKVDFILVVKITLPILWANLIFAFLTIVFSLLSRRYFPLMKIRNQ